MTRVPIACTLRSDDVPARLEEWRSLVDERVDAVERPRPEVARIRLRDGDAHVLAAVDLARRESQCCSFLRFSLDLAPDGIWLVAVAPEGSGEVLDLLVTPGG